MTQRKKGRKIGQTFDYFGVDQWPKRKVRDNPHPVSEKSLEATRWAGSQDEIEALGAYVHWALFDSGVANKDGRPMGRPYGAGVAVDIGAWLMRLSPNDLTLFGATMGGLVAAWRFVTAKLWPWWTDKYLPMREARLAKEAEINAQIERQQTTVLESIRDVMVRFEVIAQQNATQLVKHDDQFAALHGKVDQVNAKVDGLITTVTAAVTGGAK